MAIYYSLSRKEIHFGGKKSGKLYATAQHDGVVSSETFARMVARKAGGSFNEFDVRGMFSIAADLLRREILDGRRVEMGELGDFFAVLTCEGGDQVKNYAESHIKDVKVGWTPGKRLTGLMENARFHHVVTRQQQRTSKRAAKRAIDEKLAAERQKAEQTADEAGEE